MKKSILKGTMLIIIISIISRAIGLLFRIPITYLIKDYGNGLYYYPIILFNPIIAFIGAPSIAIARMVSKESDVINQYKILQSTKNSMFSLGVVISILMLLLGPVLISTIWSKDVLLPYMALVPAPIFLSLIAVYKGFFQGQQNMTPISYQQLADALGRVIFGVGLAYIFKENVIWATSGATFGTTAGTMVSFIVIYIYFRLFHHKTCSKPAKVERRSINKALISIALPIAISAIGVSLMGLVDGLLINIRLLEIGYSGEDVLRLSGVLSLSNTLIGIPLVIGTSIALNTLPNIVAASKYGLDYQQNRIRTTLIMFITLALPCGAGMFLVGKDIFAMIFPESYIDHYIIEIASLGMMMTMLNMAFTTVLQAKEKERVPVRHMYIGILIKLILSYVFLGLPSLNIHGSVLSTLMAYTVILILNIKASITYITIDVKYMILVPIISTLAMILVVLVCKVITSQVIMHVFIGGLVYGLLLLTFKVVLITDIPFIKRIIK